MKRVCIVGASGKLGQYMVQHSLDLGYEVVGVCRPKSVHKLDRFKGRITLYPGATDDRAVIEKAVEGCDAVLTVLVPRGFTNTLPERPKPCLNTPVQTLASSSPAAGIFRRTIKTFTR